MAENDADRDRHEVAGAHVGGAEAGTQGELGQSEAFLAFQEQLSRAARVNRSVLIIGESGAGKELAASRIHYLSPRWQEPLIALNCSALAPSLIESELFGHEAGAFTGAVGRRTGRFEAAHGGTLFLDEIGAIPIEVQEKILRVVEYGSFERVGSSQPTRVDVRIIGATNADLPGLAAQGKFKEDLLDRLSFEVLFLPPLRERSEDIMLLARHFGARMAHEMGWTEVVEFTEEAASVLEGHSWPGNVRELKNVVERAVYRSDDNIIEATEIIFDPFDSPYAPPSSEAPSTSVEPLRPPEPAAPGPEGKTLEEAIRDVEIALIKQAVRKAKYNQRLAAELLGVSYHKFRGLYRKYKDFLKA